MILPEEFETRRNRLMRQMKESSVAIVASAPARIRNRDVEYPYRQHSDFHYLTGFHEPEAVALLVPGRQEGAFILFCREFDPQKAIWEGRHAGLEGARTIHGADEAHPISQLEELLPEFLKNREVVYYSTGSDPELDHMVMAAVNLLRSQVRKGVGVPYEFISIEHLLHEMRLFKSDAEISAMRKASEASVSAHLRAMRATRPGRYEYEIEAELLHEFAMHGMRSPAYPCIVASGSNACVLHYTDHDALLEEGGLLLIDAGAECDNYAADITRTFPVNGRFSPSQRLIYELVLEAQQAAIGAIAPGRRWNEFHEIAVQVLTRGLVDLGLLVGDPDSLIERGEYTKFYMHRTGHWLGMDVHDVGAYQIKGQWRELEPGMVLTVEPGLYIAPDCMEVDPCWRGIGVRIEDDVLVTQNGCEVMTLAMPKTVSEIEAVLAEGA